MKSHDYPNVYFCERRNGHPTVETYSTDIKERKKAEVGERRGGGGRVRKKMTRLPC